MLIMEPDGRMVRYEVPQHGRCITINAVLRRWWQWATVWTGRQYCVQSQPRYARTKRSA